MEEGRGHEPGDARTGKRRHRAGSPHALQWVVRGGRSKADNLITGTREHRAVPGLFGFSVQSSPGKTVRRLAAAGRFPNALISVTTVERLVNAAEGAGYSIQIVHSPGRGYHATVSTPYPLTDDLATALSQAFDTIENPAPFGDVV